ncbi:MAG TPA: EpsI family protein [Terriglobales bacterium]|nr:EpsI family protein [Terriglobales bacterium]
MKPTLNTFDEPRIDRRKLLLGLLFCSVAGFAAWRRPTRHLDYLGAQKLDDLVPKSIGPWKFVAASGLVVPPKDQLLQAIYSQLLTRVYSDGEKSVMLLIAQSGGQTGFLQIHRPEICYTAGGYQISAITPHSIQVGPQVVRANAMDASMGGSTEHILYWTRVGDKVPMDWTEQKLATAEQNLQGIIPDAILVRVSMVSDDGDAAKASLDEFVRLMIASIPVKRRSVFIV